MLQFQMSCPTEAALGQRWSP